ncbi:ExeA family protein [Actimicrobium sp. CCI2.3]|uniref:ExeA family protein n=1 Tax=Actimicrobium sp. CCI2.3 TaxID=3048616 RepID=UPI002AB3F610|nr:AAA family ATPase [Actimicrobium sp. CCI2.3]MDY7576250.1 AAA family ATPase [Actimicrobium sp. CCI2.3]MEB0020546.1 AAA family ATPase [Actimicrobium sp. CCI2.3]
MYQPFFQLSQPPFSIAPDPRYLFMSERHREALAHLVFGLKGGGGFVLLTGEIGAGKTTVCRLFLEQIPARCNVAYLFNPKQSVTELLQSICDEFNIKVSPRNQAAVTVKDFIDPLNTFLLRTHAVKQNNILIIDEAQNLSADVLEQLRLLTNLETNERKLLQIILIGQPELRTMLDRPELEQLAQRIIARFHLAALSERETAQYIAHRLAVAGGRNEPLFSERAMRRIHQCARGIPRRINLLCDRALLGAYATGLRRVDVAIIDEAAREVFRLDGAGASASTQRWRSALAGGVAGVVLLGGVLLGYNRFAAVPVKAAALGPVRAATAVSAAAVPPVPANQSAGVPRVASSAARDLPAAYQRLARLWQVTLADGDACNALQKENVYCFDGRGLTDLRQLDRPAILTLNDDDGKDYYAVLTGLNATNASLQIDGIADTVSLAVLARRWNGDFRTLWRGPAGYRTSVSPGTRGPVADWLAAQLAAVDGVPTPPDGMVVDERRVRRFQLMQGLKPDGIAGPQTLMRLASAAGLVEPRLQSLSVAARK